MCFDEAIVKILHLYVKRECERVALCVVRCALVQDLREIGDRTQRPTCAKMILFVQLAKTLCVEADEGVLFICERFADLLC